MKEYNFEFTDTNFTLKLFGICFLTFMVMLAATVLTIDLIGVVASLILAFAFPSVIFLLNKKNIKKHGSAILYNSYSEFNLLGSRVRILYTNMKTYQIERYKGTHLIIEFKNDKKFNLRANSDFCNPEQFDTFCQAFDTLIQEYQRSNNIELIKKKSMFEKKWMLPFLIILTAGLAGGILFVISQGKRIPLTFYTSAAIMVPLWVGYFNARSKKNS